MMLNEDVKSFGLSRDDVQFWNKWRKRNQGAIS